MLSSPDWQKGWGTVKPGWSPRKGGRLSTFLGASRVVTELCRPDRTIRVEYDATRLTEAKVEGLLRAAGFNITEKLSLA